MNNKYAIINIETIQERIEELEKMNFKTSNEDERGFTKEVWNDLINDSELSTEYKILKQFIAKSTPLIPEIEKSFDTLRPYVGFNDLEDVRQEYINNLKLDI